MSLFEPEKTRPSNSHLRYNVPLRNTRTKIRSNFSPEPNHPHDESKNSLPHIQQKPSHRLVQSRNASFVISKTQETDNSMRNQEKSPLRVLRHNTSYRSVTPFDERENQEKSFGESGGKKKEYASILEGQIKEKDEIKIQEKLKEKELEKIVQQGDFYYRRFGKMESLQNENKKVRPLLRKLEKNYSTSTIQDFSSVKERTMTETMMTTQGTQDGMNTMSSMSKFQRTEHSPESTMSIRRRVRTEDGGEEERMKDYLKKLEYKKQLDMQMLEKKMKKKKEEELLAYEEKMDYLKGEYNRLMVQVAQPPKYIPKIEDPDKNISYDSKNLMELSKILEMYKPPKRGDNHSGSPVKTDLSTGRTTTQGKQKLGALDETIKRRTMKHSYSTADETNNSPNYTSLSSQSINKVLGPADLTTISFSKLEAMSAHLKKVVQTIGKGDSQENTRSYNTLPHLERSTEKKKPIKLVLTKGNLESKKIGQLKRISQDIAIKQAYGLPGEVTGLTKAMEEGKLRRAISDGKEQYGSLRAKSVEKSGDYRLQTGSFDKEIKGTMKKKVQVTEGGSKNQKTDVSGLQIVIPETPPSERETTWQRVSVQKDDEEIVEEDITVNDEEEEEKSVNPGGIFKKTKSTEVLKKPIKITVNNTEKSVVVLPEKQEKKGVGSLEAIKEEEEDAQPATSNNLKVEEGKPLRLTFTFKQEEEEQENGVRQSQERKVRKHSQDLVFNPQGQKRKRSELDEISVFESGSIEKGSLGGKDTTK